MKIFFQHIFLVFIWLILTMELSLVNILVGFLISFLVLWFVYRKNKNTKYFTLIPRTIVFLAFFLKEIIKGALRLGFDIITPKHYMTPGIIAVPLDAKTDLEITLLANAITLTPGTTSISVSKDRSILYVYNVYLDKNDKEKNITEIKNGLEKKLLEVLR
ncbi:MAG: Na+/H+ antiporter subunit E [Bacteroidota bacterium]